MQLSKYLGNTIAHRNTDVTKVIITMQCLHYGQTLVFYFSDIYNSCWRRINKYYTSFILLLPFYIQYTPDNSNLQGTDENGSS